MISNRYVITEILEIRNHVTKIRQIQRKNNPK